MTATGQVSLGSLLTRNVKHVSITASGGLAIWVDTGYVVVGVLAVRGGGRKTHVGPNRRRMSR